MRLVIEELTRIPIVAAGSKYKETLILETKNIHIPDVKGKTINRARKKYLNQDHINKLTVSLKEIDYSKRPPIVVKTNKWVGDQFYGWELICGSHRGAAFEKMGVTKWIFDVYVLGTDGVNKDLAMSSLQIQENDHQPELASTADDLINIMSYLVSKKLIANTEKAIKVYLNENTSNLHHGTFKKVVFATVRKNGAYQDVRTFPSTALPKFLESHIRDGEEHPYVHGGKHDVERDKFGWTVLEGYEQEYFTNALKKLVETGKGSYFLLHTKAPTEKRGLDTRRKDMKETFELFGRAAKKAVEWEEEHGEWPWEIEAFMGQDVKNSENSFLSVLEAISTP